MFAMQAQEETSRGIEIYLAVTLLYFVSAFVDQPRRARSSRTASGARHDRRASDDEPRLRLPSELGRRSPASSLKGFFFSIQLTLVAMIGGIVLGTVLALMRLSGKKWLVLPAAVYVNTLRSIPLVMVILWFFLLIPLLIGTADRRRAVGDHHLHAVRGGVLLARSCAPASRACRTGQVYAGYAVGMTYRQTMQLIVLPQAFRNMLPVLLTQTIILFQDTSLVYAIGAYDLLKGFEVAGKNFNRPVETYLVAAVVYFVICFACRCWCAGCRRRSPSSAEENMPQ